MQVQVLHLVCSRYLLRIRRSTGLKSGQVVLIESLPLSQLTACLLLQHGIGSAKANRLINNL